VPDESTGVERLPVARMPLRICRTCKVLIRSNPLAVPDLVRPDAFPVRQEISIPIDAARISACSPIRFASRWQGPAQPQPRQVPAREAVRARRRSPSRRCSPFRQGEAQAFSLAASAPRGGLHSAVTTNLPFPIASARLIYATTF
jgi:hypothetical protein